MMLGQQSAYGKSLCAKALNLCGDMKKPFFSYVTRILFKLESSRRTISISLGWFFQSVVANSFDI
jgi:hypothetical protein